MDHNDLFQLYANLPYDLNNPLERTFENLLDAAQDRKLFIPNDLSEIMDLENWELSIQNYDKVKAKSERLLEVRKLKTDANKYQLMADALLDKAEKALVHIDEKEMQAKDIISMVKVAKELQQYQLQLSKETAPMKELNVDSNKSGMSSEDYFDLLEESESESS